MATAVTGEKHPNEITCCTLDDWISNKTLLAGGVVFHEFLHWEYLTSTALGSNAQVVLSRSQTGIIHRSQMCYFQMGTVDTIVRFWEQEVIQPRYLTQTATSGMHWRRSGFRFASAHLLNLLESLRKCRSETSGRSTGADREHQLLTHEGALQGEQRLVHTAASNPGVPFGVLIIPDNHE
jgi:hypothetical protein